MPTYVYQCAKCDDQFEEWQSFSDKPLTRHAGCGGKLAKVLQPVGIVLKGSGFYRTDNRSESSKSSRAKDGTKDTKSDSSSSGTSGNGSGAKSDGATAKPDAKSSSQPAAPAAS